MKKVSGIWQLTTLMMIHFFADMIGGVLSGVLPCVREHFGIGLKLGVIFLATRSISSNFFQIAIGNMRKRSQKPFFLYVGLCLLMMIALLGVLPKDTPFAILLLFAIIFGIGTAAVHPEGLRGAMGIEDINVATATSAFMMVGFFGFSAGPLVGALIVEGISFSALWLLILPLLLTIFCLKSADIVLITDRNKNETKSSNQGADYTWTFPQLYLIALLLNIGATILQALLPTYLYESMGFSLKYGGVMALLFGLGSALGSFGGGYLSKKYPIPNIIMSSMAIGIPLLVFYILTCQYPWSGIFIFLAGMFVSSSLPLLVVLARFAHTRLPIGVKMGVMVGGSWGVAAVIFLLLGGPIEYFGVDKAIKIVVSFYILALSVAYLSRKH
ncbi:MAG: MFS transporter [Lentisphaeria bacterium]|nr:MFS transporter [Lentisphaeria bacterium]MBR7126972.1 MFS transporter [Lentisphaeria bacterium]